MRHIISIARGIGFIGDKAGQVIYLGKDKVKWVKIGTFSAWNTATTWVDNKFIEEKNALVGGDSGIHVSKIGSNRKFGNSNLDENGCGYAIEATILKAYDKSTLNDTVTWTEAVDLLLAVITRASFFSDILFDNSIRTSYTNSKKDIRGAIVSGNPTIFLGQDTGNKPKIK